MRVKLVNTHRHRYTTKANKIVMKHNNRLVEAMVSSHAYSRSYTNNINVLAVNVISR